MPTSKTLESEIYFSSEKKWKRNLFTEVIDICQTKCKQLFITTNNIWKLTLSSTISKKQTLLSNGNITLLTFIGLKNELISEVHKVKKVFLTTDNNQIKDNKREKETPDANNDSSHTTAKNNTSNNNTKTNGNNNNDNIQDTITPNLSLNPSENEPPMEQP